MVTSTVSALSGPLCGLYALVELAALALLIWAIGVGWTLVVVAATFMAGVLLVASQVRGQLAAARRAGTDPRAAVTDGVLVALGSFLVFLPGLVSTAAGILMLAPPTRGGCGRSPPRCSPGGRSPIGGAELDRRNAVDGRRTVCRQPVCRRAP